MVTVSKIRHNLRSETNVGNRKPYKNDEKYVLFHHKALFVLKIIIFLSWIFGHVEKQLD